MDAQHEEHLKRILQNRRARGAPSVEPEHQPAPPAYAPPAQLQGTNPPASFQGSRPPLNKPQTFPVPAPVPAETVTQPSATSYRSSSQTDASRVDDHGGFMGRVQNLFYNSARPAVPTPIAQAQPSSAAAYRSSSQPDAAEASMLPTRADAVQREQITRGDLFQRGLFENFRHRPVLVSSNIRPYTKSPSGRSASASQMRSSSNQGPDQNPVVSVTQDNPFRNQTFESFLAAPNNAASQRQVVKAQPIEAAPEPSVKDADPIFNIGECLPLLQRGDWFMKWTRRQDRVHRRYFWLDAGRGVLYWAKSPGASVYFSSGLRLEDISSVESDCIVEDSTGKMFYVLLVSTTERYYQVGTEQREKFDVWFDTLSRLTEHAREYNLRHHSRYVQNGGAMYRGAAEHD